MNYYETVKEFHEAFVPDVVPNEPKILSEERHELRMRLIHEEWIETLKAIRDDDKEQILDGLCDLMYVVTGYAVEAGIFITNFYVENQNPALLTVIGKEMSDLVIAYYGSFSMLNISLSLNLMSDYILSFASYLGFFDFEKAFAEVHRSNMAKLWTDEEIESSLANPNHKMAGYNFSLVQQEPNRYAVTRQDGKVMKPPTWTPPNLKQFLI